MLVWLVKSSQTPGLLVDSANAAWRMPKLTACLAAGTPGSSRSGSEQPFWRKVSNRVDLVLANSQAGVVDFFHAILR